MHAMLLGAAGVKLVCSTRDHERADIVRACTCDDAHANQVVVAHELQVMRDVRVVRLEHPVAFVSANFPAMKQASQTRDIMRTIQVAEAVCDV